MVSAVPRLRGPRAAPSVFPILIHQVKRAVVAD